MLELGDICQTFRLGSVKVEVLNGIDLRVGASDRMSIVVP